MMDNTKPTTAVDDKVDAVAIPVNVIKTSAPIPDTATAPEVPDSTSTPDTSKVPETPVVPLDVPEKPDLHFEENQPEDKKDASAVGVVEPTIQPDVPVVVPAGKSLQELVAQEMHKEEAAPQLSEQPIHKIKHSKRPIVLVTVLLVLALAGGGAFAYLQSTKKNKAATLEVAPKQSTTTSQVKASDLTKTTTDIDTTLKKVDDTKDYAANDLSDATLGL